MIPKSATRRAGAPALLRLCIAAVSFAVIALSSRAEQVIFTEVHYNPPAGQPEFIEIYNNTSTPFDFGTWYFSDGVDFTFPAVTLPPGEFLVVAADLASFEAAYGVLGRVVGGWAGRLSNSGERVRLYESGGIEVDDVSHSDEGDWTVRERVSDSVGWDWNSDHDGGGQSPSSE